VDRPQALDRVLCQALDLAGTREIRCQGQGLAAALAYLKSGLLEFLLMASGEHHAAALGGESGGNGFPDALARPGDQHSFLFQSKVHRS
jgi:hypothetical protein